jgi:hypothetical protein
LKAGTVVVSVERDQQTFPITVVIR